MHFESCLHDTVDCSFGYSSNSWYFIYIVFTFSTTGIIQKDNCSLLFHIYSNILYQELMTCAQSHEVSPSYKYSKFRTEDLTKFYSFLYASIKQLTMQQLYACLSLSPHSQLLLYQLQLEKWDDCISFHICAALLVSSQPVTFRKFHLFGLVDK